MFYTCFCIQLYVLGYNYTGLVKNRYYLFFGQNFQNFWFVHILGIKNKLLLKNSKILLEHFFKKKSVCKHLFFCFLQFYKIHHIHICLCILHLGKGTVLSVSESILICIGSDLCKKNKISFR